MRGDRGWRAHADSVIFYLDQQLALQNAAAQGDAATIHFGSKTVLHAVLHQRLKQHAGDNDVQSLRIQVFADAQLFAAEADDLDVQIIVNEFNFFAELHKIVVLAQLPAQNFGKLHNEFTRAVRIKTNQRRNR